MFDGTIQEAGNWSSILMDNEKIRQRALSLISKLAEAHGAPGSEDDVRRIFRDEAGAGAYTDKSGNILIVKRGTAASPRVMLTAHMDEVGFMVQAITKSGLIKFVPLGGWWPHTLLAQRVRVRTKEGGEVVGVIGAKPPHFLGEKEREKVLTIDEMFIDVGAVDKDDVQNRFHIELGDPIVPDSSFTPMFNPDFLLCKGFDNRVGMALVLQTLHTLNEEAHPNEVYAVGTVQEEIGVRGAQTAVFGVNPDVAVVLEGSPADDFPTVNEDERQGVLGGGVQIRIMDPSAILNRKFTQWVIDLAAGLRIPHQVAVRKSGGTDARAIHLHATGVPTVVLGVPARYIHTHNCIIHMEDYLSALKITVGILKVLDAASAERFTQYPA
jgi:putative aminopeptidase FrvX